ncbi:zinc ribbon domain-containing protein [Haladaptatus sp. DFWS20]
MSLSAKVRRWLSDDETIMYECRDCGTTLLSTRQRCPNCGSTEIASFDVS